MPGPPTGCEDYDEWIGKSAAWHRYQERQEREARFAEYTFEDERDEQPPATA
jgi:hypothetical protein